MKDHLSFDRDAMTGDIIAKQLGRIALGKGDVLARLYLLPDGIHLSIPYEALEKGYVKLYNPYCFQTYTLPEEDEGEGK